MAGVDPAAAPRLANAITAAGRRDYPEFKETVTELRALHGDQVMAAAYERISGSTTKPPVDWS